MWQQFMYGLPEKKIQKVIMEHIRVTYAENATAGVPAMLDGQGECRKMGIFVKNVSHLVLRDVVLEGQEGEAMILDGIDRLEGALR